MPPGLIERPKPLRGWAEDLLEPGQMQRQGHLRPEPIHGIAAGFRGLFRVFLLTLIAVVTLYGQTRSTTDQQREQRPQLLAFADEPANLVVVAGSSRAVEDQRRALEEAIEAIRDQEPAPEG